MVALVSKDVASGTIIINVLTARDAYIRLVGIRNTFTFWHRIFIRFFESNF